MNLALQDRGVLDLNLYSNNFKIVKRGGGWEKKNHKQLKINTFLIRCIQMWTQPIFRAFFLQDFTFYSSYLVLDLVTPMPSTTKLHKKNQNLFVLELQNLWRNDRITPSQECVNITWIDMDWIGLARIGMDWHGLVWTGNGWHALASTGLEHCEVNSRRALGPFQVNHFFRFRRSGLE